MATRSYRFGAQATACVVACIVVACAALALVFAQTADAQYSAGRALSDLNAMRAQAGLPRVKAVRPSLNRGCRMHNRYMLATGQFGHYESRSSAYYTRAGAKAAAASVIAQPAALPTAAWGDTVYHRLALLQPRLRVSGYASSYGFTCMQVLAGIRNSASTRTRGVSLYSWPPNGATSIDPLFDGFEFPDPLADAPGTSDLGSPITVSVNGPWKHWQMTRSNVTSASMVSDTGEPVALSVSDMSSPNGAYLQGGFALLPRRGLKENTGYTFTASGTVNNNGRSWPFSISSRFVTGADNF